MNDIEIASSCHQMSPVIHITFKQEIHNHGISLDLYFMELKEPLISIHLRDRYVTLPCNTGVYVELIMDQLQQSYEHDIGKYWPQCDTITVNGLIFHVLVLLWTCGMLYVVIRSLPLFCNRRHNTSRFFITRKHANQPLINSKPQT